jgi:hypothetical protein
VAVNLLVEATYAQGALSAVATKVLHRKRRSFIPILDSVMVRSNGSDRVAGILAASGASDASCRTTLTVLHRIQGEVRATRDQLRRLSEEARSG